jgi:hypothetical protein
MRNEVENENVRMKQRGGSSDVLQSNGPKLEFRAAKCYAPFQQQSMNEKFAWWWSFYHSNPTDERAIWPWDDYKEEMHRGRREGDIIILVEREIFESLWLKKAEEAET